MPKKFISIGFEIPGYKEFYEQYSSRQSLLDSDVVIFAPDLDYYITSKFQGKNCYGENESFRIKEDTQHWFEEIATVLENGINVFVFLEKYEEFYIHTGQKTLDGKGKNASVTNIVEISNNYKFLPTDINLVSKEGSEIKFNNNIVFSIFWNEFKEYLIYECYIDNANEMDPIFLTKTGDKPVGGIFRFGIGKGNLILFPMIEYPEEFYSNIFHEEWAEEAKRMGKRLIQVLNDIDNSLKRNAEKTPPPEWLDNQEYILKEESSINERIGEVSQKIKDLALEKRDLSIFLSEEILLKDLLFEKGKPLENVVLKALKLIGYQAENYNDGKLEMDQVITSPEGDRFIGETEGKDNSHINIEKFRQLNHNIDEDLQRADITKTAIGILFGNGFRLTEPNEREEVFTEKCINSAEIKRFILIRTPDLFRVAKYVKENSDEDFAKKCRDTIKSSMGKIVEFPEIPQS